MGRVGVGTRFIEPGSPWEDGYVGPFNGKPSGEPPGGEVFDTPPEARVLIERCRVRYDTGRPRSSLGCRKRSRL